MAWWAVGHAETGDRWRVSLLSSLTTPLTALQAWGASTVGALKAPAVWAENRRLRHALLRERHDIARLEELTQEVARLRRLLQLAQDGARPTVAARVIGREATPWFRTLLVDHGRQHGIPEGAAVVVEHGLLGQILDAGPAVARVLLLTDPRFRVGALVQRSRAQGLALGTVGGRCYVAYLTSDEAAHPGDLVVTSGIGGGIPKGLVIGTVARVDRDPSGLYWQAQLQLAVEATMVEEVVCLP
ncbi:MAG: rod shape-determining protein MreC [Candidatus Omnitrophica bacterium]|nr:rod shape-determining protein MreC [Candidatus Omnitrophota bacterium]